MKHTTTVPQTAGLVIRPPGGKKDALTRPQTTDCTVVVLVTVNRFPKKPVCARAICFVFLFFPQNHWHETRVQEVRTQSQRATQEQRHTKFW